MPDHGIMELWKNGILGFRRIGFSLNFIFKPNFAILPILQYSQTHFPSIPTFHPSNWGEAPNLSPRVLI
jgi:hypothetical protein